MTQLKSPHGVTVTVDDVLASALIAQGYSAVEDEKTTEQVEKPARTRRKSSTKADSK